MLNDQRKVIFEQRKEIMSADDVSDQIADFREEVVEMPGRPPHPGKGLCRTMGRGRACMTKWPSIFGVDLPVLDWTKEEGIADEEVRERIQKAVDARAAERAANFGPDVMRYVEKAILLQTLDHNWREHIVNLDHLRQYVGLRGYGQRDPLNEYKSEAFELFEALLAKLRSDVVEQLMHVQIQTGAPPPELEPRPLPADAGHATSIRSPARTRWRRMPAVPPVPAGPVDPNNPATWGKVQRNAPCPCGSGRKYKHCHGALV